VLFNDTDIVCANAGDSRAVLCRDGKCIELSKDHKPSLPHERKRILAAGSTVTAQKTQGRVVYRVNHALSLSRAIGDFAEKKNSRLGPEAQAVTAVPEVIHSDRSPKDEFIVMACDGIWDVMTSQHVIDFVRQRLRKGSTPTEVSQALIANCLSPDPKETKGLGTDNMTCIIIVLKAPPKPSLANHFGLPAILTSHFGLASLCNAQTSTTKSCVREGSCGRVARQERTKPQKNEATTRSRRSF
jgi:serine/threonine protein phosphatase PrpC